MPIQIIPFKRKNLENLKTKTQKMQEKSPGSQEILPPVEVKPHAHDPCKVIMDIRRTIVELSEAKHKHDREMIGIFDLPSNAYNISGSKLKKSSKLIINNLTYVNQKLLISYIYEHQDELEDLIEIVLKEEDKKQKVKSIVLAPGVIKIHLKYSVSKQIGATAFIETFFLYEFFEDVSGETMKQLFGLIIRLIPEGVKDIKFQDRKLLLVFNS